MRNIKCLMSYNGSRYHGFQIQQNAVTIQGTVEEKLCRILKEPVSITGCSRTDTGVHAKEYCFNFHTDNTIPPDGLKNALNALLPRDIAIMTCEEATDGFHARYDALGKEYLYRLRNKPVRDVFQSELTFLYPYPVDAEELNRIAKVFTGTHDFAAFCKAESKTHLASTVRTIHSFTVERAGDEIHFYISGDGFLHNMVRILVGTLIYYSEGKRTLLNIENALKTGRRELAGVTAPPFGLYLNKVYYIN